jgi:hypothetical protein
MAGGELGFADNGRGGGNSICKEEHDFVAIN